LARTTLAAPLQSAVATNLLDYGPSLLHNWRLAGIYIDRILRGAKLADLPIENPKALKLVVNMRVARMLGIAVPRLLLLQADEMIE
jgi:putative ABC transport system substrate-binding protein